MVVPLGLTHSTGDIGIRRELNNGILCFFPLDLVLGNMLYPVVGNCGTQDDCITLGQRLHHCIVHLDGCGDIDAVDVTVLDLEGDRTRHKSHISTTTGALLGKSKAHFTGREIADIAHRVDFLYCRTCSDEHMFSFQVLAR